MRELDLHPFGNARPAPAARRPWRLPARSFAGGFAKEHPGSPGPAKTPLTAEMQVIIGNDDRQRVMQTKVYPARAIAQVRVRYTSGNELSGTGWFISPSVIVTAAHVISAPGDAVKLIAAAPGRNEDTLPYGFSDGVKWTASARWNGQPGGPGDYAAIELKKPLGSAVGFFGLRSFTDLQLGQHRFWVAGYPTDKPDGTMWAHDGPVTATDTFLQYLTDTEGGESGAPVFVKMSDGCWAAGIHVGGVGGVGNRAIRINSAVFDELSTWKSGL